MSDELRHEWGRRIAARRQDKGLSQMDLAAAVQVDKGHISNLEIGRSLPSDALRIRLARALEIDPNELFSYPAVAGPSRPSAAAS